VKKVSHDSHADYRIRLFFEDLAVGRVLEPDGSRNARRNSAETARLTQMVRTLLGWSRMEAGKRGVPHGAGSRSVEIAISALATPISSAKPPSSAHSNR